MTANEAIAGLRRGTKEILKEKRGMAFVDFVATIPRLLFPLDGTAPPQTHSRKQRHLHSPLSHHERGFLICTNETSMKGRGTLAWHACTSAIHSHMAQVDPS